MYANADINKTFKESMWDSSKETVFVAKGRKITVEGPTLKSNIKNLNLD